MNGHLTIGDHVHVFPNVVVGRYDAELKDYAESEFEHIVIEDHVIIYANAVVVGGPGVTTLGAGSIVGAGSVLLGSTGAGEVWAGNPARKVGVRPGWERVDPGGRGGSEGRSGARESSR